MFFAHMCVIYIIKYNIYIHINFIIHIMIYYDIDLRSFDTLTERLLSETLYELETLNVQ